jgi:hypothetical protein
VLQQGATAEHTVPRHRRPARLPQPARAWPARPCLSP